MPKGILNKRYTPKFKKMVVETMRKDHFKAELIEYLDYYNNKNKSMQS